MASLTSEDEHVLAKLKAAVKTALPPGDAAQCITARTVEPVGLNAQGEPFKPQSLVDIFAGMEPEDDTTQTPPALVTARK